MKKIIAVAAITAIFIIGLMVGASEPTVLAQTTPPAETVVESDPDLEWEMFSGNIAGYGGAAAGTGTSNTFAFPQTTTVPGGTQVSTVFLYNRRTGEGISLLQQLRHQRHQRLHGRARRHRNSAPLQLQSPRLRGRLGA